MALLGTKNYDYKKASAITPMLNFDDLEIGVTYHIPPTFIYDRRDFTPEKKYSDSTIYGEMVEADGRHYKYSLYKTELSMKYIVKKLR